MPEQTPTAAPATVRITIDGKPVDARPGELVIAAADRHGIDIPRFCYHPRMSSVGMCRMCLVEIDGPRGPSLQVSCMVPVAEGMAVHTESPAVKKAQDGVLEFLLINHPLDCPVCDKGGECPLQDQTMAHGPGESRFVEEKRHYAKPIPINDLVYLDRERCILCDRCTRFASEVAGDPFITFAERGNNTRIATFPGQSFDSVFSGNVTQICPVGALTAKPYRFRARPWDLEEVESTCTTCSMGCRMTVQSSRNRLIRYEGVDTDPVNWGWLCDKGRYGYEALEHDERLGAPLVRAGGPTGDLAPASWGEALRAAAAGIKAAVDRDGPASVAVIGGARGTNEDAYAWAKLAKAVIGTDNVDAQVGDGLPAELVLGLPQATIDDACAARVCVLLTPDLEQEIPVLHLRLRDAATKHGLALVELSPVATRLSPLAAASLRYRPGDESLLVRALLGQVPASTVGLPASEVDRVGKLLRGPDGKGTGAVVVLGRPSLAEDPATVEEAADDLLEGLPGATFLPVLRRGNVHGALDMGLAPGFLPGRVGLAEGRSFIAEAWGSAPATEGLDTAGILEAAAEGRIGALVLLGADPVADFPDRDLARRGLAGANFVVAVDAFVTDSSRHADVVLPAAAFGEKSGTTTNLEGRVSTVEQKVTPPGTARPDWMIAAELALALGGDLGLESPAQIWAEIEDLSPVHEGVTWEVLHSPATRDGVVVPLPRHAVELVERAADAQARLDAGATDIGEAFVAAAQADAATALGDIQAAEAAAVREVVEAVLARRAAGQAPPPRVRPEPVHHSPAGRHGDRLPVDAYSLRLVSARSLFDAGVAVRHAPSLAGLAPLPQLRANPADLGPMGITDGAEVRVTSRQGSVVVAARHDPGVPRGTAALAFNQPGAAAADLIRTGDPVTDVRIETR